MKATLAVIAALFLIPATSYAKPGLSLDLAGGGGLFVTTHPQGYTNRMVVSRLGAGWGINERVELGLVLGAGISGGNGLGYIEPHVKVNVLKVGRLQPYLKGGLSLTISEGMLGSAFLAGMDGEPAEDESDIPPKSNEGLSLVLGAGASYFLSDSWYAMLELSNQLGSMGAEASLTNSLHAALGVGVNF